MNSSDTTVSAELDFMLLGPDGMVVPLIASMFYGNSDPYAVRVAFHNGTDRPVEWVFGRDLLACGLTEPEGIGDVRLWPSPGILNIEMSAPAGRAHVQAPADDIAEFLRRTYQIVPAGQETSALDIDAELHVLLR